MADHVDPTRKMTPRPKTATSQSCDDMATKTPVDPFLSSGFYWKAMAMGMADDVHPTRKMTSRPKTATSQSCDEVATKTPMDPSLFSGFHMNAKAMGESHLVMSTTSKSSDETESEESVGSFLPSIYVNTSGYIEMQAMRRLRISRDTKCAVLESSGKVRTSVRVMYYDASKDFVLRLTEELKTRTALRLVSDPGGHSPTSLVSDPAEHSPAALVSDPAGHSPTALVSDPAGHSSTSLVSGPAGHSPTALVSDRYGHYQSSKRRVTEENVKHGITIVVIEHGEIPFYELEEALRRYSQRDRHTFFIWTREQDHHHKDPEFLLPYRFSDSIVTMFFPHAAADRQPLFWDTLARFIGEPDMDLTRRDMLNDFGLVQHAVFESADHNAVHVIYRHAQKPFVNTELTKELETRTGLQLVRPQSRVATSSSKGDGVVIVIVDGHDSLTDRLLYCDDSLTNRLLLEVVKTAGHPDTHTLFIQKRWYCPLWVYSKLPHSTLMLYPQSDVERSQFWTTLTTMIGDPDMDLTRRVMLNDFGLVQHAVLASPDHNNVYVIYEYTQKDFVHTELTKELETRTGLQLVPPQSRVATSSSKGDGVVIVIVYSHDSLTDRLLREAVETSGHPDTHTLFLQKERYRPDWVDNKLPHSTLMLYPQSDGERSQFWTTLTTMIGAPDMDLTRRAILNDFGLVQHAVLESPDHSTVHVIYSRTQKDFVHTELTKELETRTGLQLVPLQNRVATSSSKGDGVVIVIADSRGSLTDRLLREAVETAGHPDTHTLFIQKGLYRPLWVNNKLPRSTLMLCPLFGVERSQFWTTLTTMIGAPDMDLTRRAILNDFGLVQHAVLESPDHSTVHVIYSRTQKDFVHAELTKELETRTGLQLVPLQNRVATSSSKGDGVVIVIADSRGSLTDRLLREAVETAGHPDTHTLFLQKGTNRPDWVNNKLSRSALMVYPESSVERSQFWTTLTTMIEHHSPGVGEDVEHDSVPPETSSAPFTSSTFQQNICDNSASGEDGTSDGSDEDDAHCPFCSTSSSSSSSGSSDAEGNGCPGPRDPDDRDCPTSVDTDPVTGPQSLADTDPVTGPQTRADADPVTGPQTRVDADPATGPQTRVDTDPATGPQTRVDTDPVTGPQTRVDTDPATGPQTRVDTDPATGPQTRVDTDPVTGPQSLADADPATGPQSLADTDPVTGPQTRADTDPATGPQIRADTDPVTGPQTRADTDPVTGPQTRADTDPVTGPQTCADTVAGQGRGLPPPIVSVHWQAAWKVRPEGGCYRKTGSDVILQVPPEAVQEDGDVVVHAAICADVDCIRRLLKLSDDEQIVTPLAEYWAGQDFRFQSPVSITLPHFLPPDYDPDRVRVYHVTRTHDGRIIPTRINEGPETGKVPEDGATTLDDSDVRLEEKHPGCIQSEESHIQLFTDHFCGYVCTYCDKEVKKNGRPRPQLYVMGSGSLTATPDSRYHLDVFASVWDGRIRVADFRQEHGIKEGDFVLVELLDTLCGSQLQLTMRMWDEHKFIHCLDQRGTPLLAIEKCFDLSRFLGCKKCHNKGKLLPKRLQWALQSAVTCRSWHGVKLAVDVTHTSADKLSSQNTTLLLQVAEVIFAQKEGTGHATEQWRHLLSTFDTAQLEVVMGNLDSTGLERRQRRKQRCSDEDYRKELIEMCCRQDPGRISATFATLMPSTPAPQLMPSSHLTNDTDNMLSAAAGDGCHVHSANSTSTQLSSQIGASVQHPFPDFQGDSVDSAGRPGGWHSEANSQKDSVRGCVDGAREETNLKGRLRPVARDQCWSTARSGDRQTGSSSTTLMCRLVQEARIERNEGGGSYCTIVQRKDIAGDPSLLPNAGGVQSSMLPIQSTLNSMVYDDEATFKYIDRDIVLMVAEKLTVDGNHPFFLRLGLSNDQFEILNKKHGSDLHTLNLKCLITWCRSKREDATVDKLIEALESIDRNDIAEAVKGAVVRKENLPAPNDITRP